MSHKERSALVILIAVGLAGHLIRLVAVGPQAPPGGVSILSASGPGDVARHRAVSAAAGRPLARGEKIDLNSASASEIARLPGVGAGLASKLIAERRARGGFRSVAEVDSVPGIGEAMLARIAPHLAFGDTNRVRGRGGAGARSVAPAAPPAPVVIVPKAGPERLSGDLGPGVRVRVNSASESELVALPGIGQVKAKAIIAYRQANGPFASVKDLEKVPGMTPNIVRRLAPQVVIQ